MYNQNFQGQRPGQGEQHARQAITNPSATLARNWAGLLTGQQTEQAQSIALANGFTPEQLQRIVLKPMQYTAAVFATDTEPMGNGSSGTLLFKNAEPAFVHSISATAFKPTLDGTPAGTLPAYNPLDDILVLIQDSPQSRLQDDLVPLSHVAGVGDDRFLYPLLPFVRGVNTAPVGLTWRIREGSDLVVAGLQVTLMCYRLAQIS